MAVEYVPTPAEVAANVDKAIAEAHAARARALKDDAEAQKFLAERDIARHAARAQELGTVMAQISVDEQLRAKREQDARDFDHGVFRFNREVGAESVQSLIAQLALFSRLYPEKPVRITFDSPGGSVFAGMHLFDYLQELKAAGHEVTTHTQGMAASMAGILLQAGTKRTMGAEAYILIHEISTLSMGKSSEIEDEVEFLKRIQARVIDIFVSRSGGKLKASTVRANWKRKDWWLSSDDALKLGIVDEVVG